MVAVYGFSISVKKSPTIALIGATGKGS